MKDKRIFKTVIKYKYIKQALINQSSLKGFESKNIS